MVAWGQVFAYLSEVRRMIIHHGPSIVYLPHARLTKERLGKASGQLDAIASQEGRSHGEVIREAAASVRDSLVERGELDRFEAALERLPH